MVLKLFWAKLCQTLNSGHFCCRYLVGVNVSGEIDGEWRLGASIAVRDSIMTTIIHNVSRMASACSSEELAEPHVNKVRGCQQRSAELRKERKRELWKHQVATYRLSHLRHRLPLNNDNTGVR
jgi:hypothetical protein